MRPILPDHPTGAALLDVARRALLDEIAPTLTGRPRYVVLMVANAMGIAMREMDETETSAQAWDRALAPVAGAVDNPLAALATAIRSGRTDGDSELYAALQATTEIAAGIWKPALTAKTCTAKTCTDKTWTAKT